MTGLTGSLGNVSIIGTNSALSVDGTNYTVTIVDKTETPDLDSLLAAMLEADEHSTYSVAWVDTLASGASLGRAVLTTGEHAPLSDLSRRAAENPLAFAPRQIAGK